VVDDALTLRRSQFARVVVAARVEAADLGHDLHPEHDVDGNPWHVEAFCRRCGAGIVVRVYSDGAEHVQGYALVDRCRAS
jgi:hypothetical protein